MAFAGGWRAPMPAHRGGSTVQPWGGRRRRSRPRVSRPQLASILNRKALDGKVITVVEIEGTELIPEDIVETLKTHYEGKIVSEDDMHDGAEWIRTWYVDNGYALNDAYVKQLPNSNSGTLVYGVHERKLMGVTFRHSKPGGMMSDGPGRTLPKIVMRTLGLSVGEHFRMPEGRFQKLGELNLFDDVRMRPNDMDDNTVHLIIELIEQPYLEIVPAFTLSFRSGLSGSVSVKDNNFMGKGQKVSLTGKATESNGPEFEFEFVNPRFDSGRMKYGWSLVHSRAHSNYLQARLWTLTPLKGSLSFGTENSFEREDENGQEGELKRQVSMGVNVINDKRRGGEIRNGYRQEVVLKQGFSSVGLDDGSDNKFWHALLRGAIFQSFLKGQAGACLGVDFNQNSENYPKITHNAFEYGELRGTTVPTFRAESTWAKSIAELRFRITPSITGIAYAEAAKAVNQPAKSTAGIGIRLLGALTIVYAPDKRGNWAIRFLPIDRTM
eukprot:CAMPEP_0198724552 /NCGR_PEP_ID=MMETSP1475-20131203/2017_1 /TAXON_ID= ORGANISM="Unidentified sp., Strain CCMP1999" /NCGR_SAMPLE_ID=MMETSP1475 /ASSEMBLY_ACC=CAM_ASM_001111 /LENGTH=495 /DNA_ID=CAMNT_0044486115 /DNA_START=270 /DNA_END=1757 /DNA_ORIENTATION=+